MKPLDKAAKGSLLPCLLYTLGYIDQILFCDALKFDPKFSMPFGDQLENQNPTLYLKTADRFITEDEHDDAIVDDFDQREIFDLIRNINDPEHPLSLEELHVVQQELITVNNEKNDVQVNFTPTIPHCSMATLIGLSIRVKLLRCLPSRFKVTVEVTPGTHNAESQVNKQLADKERVAAALENNHLIKVINQCIAPRNKG